MSKVFVVYSHDVVIDSVENAFIIEEIRKSHPEVEIDNIDELYPDFAYDIEAEQKKLEAADVIVLQFPFYWFSMPGTLHRWMEYVFRHGWSHGRTGDKLKGKKLLLSFTTGAPQEAYERDGATGHTLDDLLAPFKVTAGFCQMEYMGYVVTTGVSYADRKPEAAGETRAKARDHVERLFAKIAG